MAKNWDANSEFLPLEPGQKRRRRKKPGRPKGSKNKSKQTTISPAEPEEVRDNYSKAKSIHEIIKDATKLLLNLQLLAARMREITEVANKELES